MLNNVFLVREVAKRGGRVSTRGKFGCSKKRGGNVYCVSNDRRVLLVHLARTASLGAPDASGMPMLSTVLRWLFLLVVPTYDQFIN